jgi:hypothetical protein
MSNSGRGIELCIRVASGHCATIFRRYQKKQRVFKKHLIKVSTRAIQPSTATPRVAPFPPEPMKLFSVLGASRGALSGMPGPHLIMPVRAKNKDVTAGC